MQTTAIRTVVNSLPKNEVILLTILISRRYIPYTDLNKIFCIIFATVKYQKNNTYDKTIWAFSPLYKYM